MESIIGAAHLRAVSRLTVVTIFNKYFGRNYLDRRQPFPFRFYLFLAIAVFAFFAIVTYLVLTIAGQFDPSFTFVILIKMFISPLVGTFGWLIDKGSLGENREAAIKTICAYPGMFFGGFTGGIIGSAFLGTLGGAILGGIVLILSVFFGLRSGPIIMQKYLEISGQ